VARAPPGPRWGSLKRSRYTHIYIYSAPPDPPAGFAAGRGGRRESEETGKEGGKRKGG